MSEDVLSSVGRASIGASVIHAVACERWGDVPKTVETKMWEDGGYTVTVYHTIDTDLTDQHGRPVDWLRARLVYNRDVDRLYEMVSAKKGKLIHNLYDEEVDR